MSKKRILIVDDEAAFTRMVKFALEKTGRYEVKEENQPEHCQAVAWGFKPDLIILDIMMPGMDGSQVAEQLKADPRLAETPIIFVTAIIPKEELEDAGQRRYILYVRKPATLVQLVEGIEEALHPVNVSSKRKTIRFPKKPSTVRGAK